MEMNPERYDGNLFIQTDPSDEFEFLTCTGVGDTTIPKGARTLKYKQDLRRSGKLVASGSIQGVADFANFNIIRPLNTVNNYLQEIDCPFNARLNWACRGTRTILSNYELGAFIIDSAFTSSTISNPLSGGETENDRINTTGDVSGARFTYVYPLAGKRLTMVSTTDVYALAVVPSECASRCGDKVGLGQIVWAGFEETAYTVGYIQVSRDYGATWNHPAGWWPFAVAGDISSIVIVDSASGYRVICARGSAAVGPAEVSFSDDEGATGTDVEVGIVNGQTIQMLRKDLRGRIWAVATDGDIYMSATNGASWSANLGGTVTTEDLYDIVFYDDNVGYSVGNANAFLVTVDGGLTWTAGVGPSVGDNLISIDVNYAGHIYVTNDDAELWRSTDQGATWELMLDLAGTMNQVRFDDDFRYFGYLVVDSAAPVGTLYRSEDAGNTWAQIGVPATDYLNAGINCVAVCDANMAYAGGAPQAATSFVAKFTRQT